MPKGVGYGLGALDAEGVPSKHPGGPEGTGYRLYYDTVTEAGERPASGVVYGEAAREGWLAALPGMTEELAELVRIEDEAFYGDAVYDEDVSEESEAPSEASPEESGRREKDSRKQRALVEAGLKGLQSESRSEKSDDGEGKKKKRGATAMLVISPGSGKVAY